MFSSEPVSRLSRQITRCPLPSRCSQRWEPRKPAPPVTTQVVIATMLSGYKFHGSVRKAAPAFCGPAQCNLTQRIARLETEMAHQVLVSSSSCRTEFSERQQSDFILTLECYGGGASGVEGFVRVFKRNFEGRGT